MKPATPKMEQPPASKLRKAVFGDAPKQAVFLLLSIVLLLAGGATAARGQSALDGYDPNANDRIYVVAVQTDGKILIGGSFTSLSPNGGAAVTCNHIARLNPNGTVDTNFNPNANGTVYAITVAPGFTNDIFVGGDFSSIGGQPRKFIARLDATTGMAQAFDANANSGVRSIALQQSDTTTVAGVLVGGLFNGPNSIGGQSRNYIARLDPQTGVADSFDPNANDSVLTIMAPPFGNDILVGGAFSNIGGQSRNGIARLDSKTSLADSLNPNANNAVYSIAQQADGKILAAGNFTSIGGQPRRGIARLDATTGLADSFDPKPNNDLRSIVVQPDGRILAGGYFTTLSPNGGGPVARNFIARLNPDGSLDPTFDPNANGDVQAIALRYDLKIMVGGSFTALAPSGGTPLARNYVALLETDGRLDRTLDLDIVGSSVEAIAVQPDGKFLIGGLFTSVLGVPRGNIARLNTDGSLDLAFNPNANGSIYAISVQPDGKVLACGEFHGINSIGGATRNYIARLDGATGTADSFNPNASATVFAMSLQADGKVLACGVFTNIGIQPRNYLARLDATSGWADSFDPNPDGIVNSIAVQADGMILAGGNFSNTGGAARSYLARLDATNGLADSFNPNPGNSVTSIVVDQDRGVLVGGSFTNIGGATRNHIALLDKNGFLQSNLDPNADDLVLSIAWQAEDIVFGGQFSKIGGQMRHHIARLAGFAFPVDSYDPNASDSVRSLAVQRDGKVLAGGLFTGTNSIGGQTRKLFARLSSDIAGYQYLQAAATLGNYSTVYWTRSGPLFNRVTFELSTNNVDYTLVSGTVLGGGGNWSMENLNLPTGQNIYIRARGYYSSGNANGSGSIEEAVVNEFLPTPAPPVLNIQLSVNTNIVLSWETIWTGFTLETSTNLDTGVWSVVSPAPVVSGIDYVVTNAVSGSARFYRLRQ